jgi:hypothetical protein
MPRSFARVLPGWRDVPLRAITHADVVAWAADLRMVVGYSMTRQAVDILGCEPAQGVQVSASRLPFGMAV